MGPEQAKQTPENFPKSEQGQCNLDTRQWWITDKNLNDILVTGANDYFLSAVINIEFWIR